MKNAKGLTDGKTSYTPAELAAEVGISADALRFYERKGLLPAPPRSAGGHRVFGASMLNRVRVIRAALSLGFTVAELREVFRIRDAGGAPCQTVLTLATAKLEQMEAAIEQLNSTRALLASSIRKWRRQLSASRPGKRVGLLDLFAEAHPETSHQLSPWLGAGLRRRLKRARPNG